MGREAACVLGGEICYMEDLQSGSRSLAGLTDGSLSRGRDGGVQDAMGVVAIISRELTLVNVR